MLFMMKYYKSDKDFRGQDLRLDPLSVKRLFKDLASWDGERDTTNHYLRSLIIQQRLELPLFVSPDDKWMLDAGCGEGRLSLEFLKHGAKFVCALDLSSNVLRRARKRLIRKGYSASFVRGDIECLPFSPELFDIVICIDTLVHLPNPERAISELSRITKKEGKIAINMTNKNPFWLVTVYGLTNLKRFFKDLCLYYSPDLLIKPPMKLLRKKPLGRHLSKKEFKTLIKKYLKLITFREYGLGPPAFFVATGEKRARDVQSRS